MHYTPPLRDMQFVLEELLAAPALLAHLPAHADLDSDLVRQVLDAAGRFAAEVLAPLNAVGDRDGCRYDSDTGAVQTPAGFAAAYRQFCDAGWPALACATEHGGQGLPHLLNCALFEMLSATNHGWTMYPGLLHGAYACLAAHASEALQQRYLPRIVSGEWLATMCLTEAHAGSDLGLLRTRATRQDDQSYRISGDKIFISGGAQDLTGNIVHLVLARLPDAPVGSKGLSLFLVPQVLPDGTSNDVHCSGIEHKLGIHGSATCSLRFEQATGWLVGTEQQGLKAMFVMMNAARLHVGVQGVGLAEGAYQRALGYARERLQSRAPGVERPSDKPAAADAIVMLPAVQKLLMAQRCRVEGGRMLAYWGALLLDLAEHEPDAGQRHARHAQLEFITPVIKALLTEQGFDSASQALQVFGGHGYVTETGIDQYLRDARITMIYEGSNEVQAVDFLMRKVLGDNGHRMSAFLDLLEAEVQQEHPVLASQAGQLQELLQDLRRHTVALAQASQQQPQLPYFVADEMLHLSGHAALAWLWLRAARCAADRQLSEPAFYLGKQASACYYFAFLFPQVRHWLGVLETCLAHDAQAPIAVPPDLIQPDAA
jgi:alkylation response protein AidB-like acyl-CoA dehydrogenase